MNAYIASFMLLVFNAVGLVMPATAAVAEEQVMPDAKPNLAAGKPALPDDTSIVRQDDQCSNSYTDASVPLGCMAWETALSVKVSDNDVNVRAIFIHSPAHLEMADKLHVEGAP